VTTIEFIVSRLFTKVFWYYFVASLVGVLMMAWYGWARNQIFDAARQTIGKGRLACD
jgi:hypothetical protein